MYLEIQRNSDSNDKEWLNKEIGYFSTKLCRGFETENNWINEFNSSDKSEFVKYSVKDSLPNGEWDFGQYKGNFINGKQDGEWILLEVETYTKYFEDGSEVEQKNTFEIHEFYKNGIADGQWYTIKNGVSYNTHSFKNGKLNGEIILKIGKNNCIDKANFIDGFPNGKFILYLDNSQNSKIFGSYKMGIPNGTWGAILNNKELLKIEFIDSLGIVRYTDFDFHNRKQIIEYDISIDFNITQSRWFNDNNLSFYSKNKKYFDFYENGKIKRIWYSGTDEYRKGKKDQEFHPNGKIKIEGVLGEYRKEYDINGKLIKTSDNYKSF